MATKKPQDPTKFLDILLGREVIIRLTNNTSLKGILVSIDNSMNALVEQCDEYEDDTVVAHYAESFIRGNNIVYLGINKPSQ